jgi:hypothetical protein
LFTVINEYIGTSGTNLYGFFRQHHTAGFHRRETDPTTAALRDRWAGAAGGGLRDGGGEPAYRLAGGFGLLLLPVPFPSRRRLGQEPEVGVHHATFVIDCIFAEQLMSNAYERVPYGDPNPHGFPHHLYPLFTPKKRVVRTGFAVRSAFLQSMNTSRDEALDGLNESNPNEEV